MKDFCSFLGVFGKIFFYRILKKKGVLNFLEIIRNVIHYFYLASFGMTLVRAVDQAPVSTVVSKLMCTEMKGVV